MKTFHLIVGLILFISVSAIAQRTDIVLLKDKRDFAEESIKKLKEGALVVRLKTNHRKISMLQATLRSPKLKKNQRKRHQKLLDNTLQTRDEFNNAIADMFLDSFSFCKVYLMYDTASKALSRGTRKDIFLGRDKKVDTSIVLKEKEVFLVNYRKQSGDFPFDVLIMRKLKERLVEPFPYFVQLRSSWINNINTPGAARAVIRLDKKLHKLYAQTLEQERKNPHKANTPHRRSIDEKSPK